MELNDLELVRLARGGDGSALACLFERHYRSAYLLAYRWCGSRQDAEDVAQEVFIKVARALRTFRENSSFSTWLYRIVVNTARDMHRRNAARTRLVEDAERQALAEEHGAGADPPDSPAGKIWEAVAALPEKQRTALLLVYGEGLSHREAAAVMACPEVTVSWRVHRARRTLGKIMESRR